MNRAIRVSNIAPSQELISVLVMDYLRRGKPLGLTFEQFMEIAGYFHPGDEVTGLDDNASFKPGPSGAELFPIPSFVVQGDLRMIVLLVDFRDQIGRRPRAQFEDLLFSEATYPSGSLRDYYSEASLGKVKISGTVHGWLRLPREYSYYTNNQSGMGEYPRNAQRMAEDSVQVALDNGVEFPSELDKLNQGTITALFIVHAGLGAETQLDALNRANNIWSHKWNLGQPVKLPSGLLATIYLTVPENAKLGVCAHELGHLAFQWGDFYDWNYADDGFRWDGTGAWDLMASGSYNGNAASPAHPLGLHKAQHGWVDLETVTESKRVIVPPYTPTEGRVVRIVRDSFPKRRDGQPRRYILLENRQHVGFDKALPGSGLLVWMVDEAEEMVTPFKPGVYLVQADGKHDLENPNEYNQGDVGDPFPGSTKQTELLDVPDPNKKISTIFYDGMKSGIQLRNIKVLDNKEVSVDIDFK